MFNNYFISVFKSTMDINGDWIMDFRELTEAEILEKENAISSALIDILKQTKIQSLKIRELQKFNFKVKWKNGQNIDIEMLPMLIKDCLRGNCVCRLSGQDFYAYIGEDNDLNLGCELNLNAISIISQKHGLYSGIYKHSYFTKESDYEFKTKHPIGYIFLIAFGLIVLFTPTTLYLIYALSVNPDANAWLLLGILGALIFGVGLFNFVAIIIKQYLGHKFSFITLLVGTILMFLGISL